MDKGMNPPPVGALQTNERVRVREHNDDILNSPFYTFQLERDWQMDEQWIVSSRLTKRLGRGSDDKGSKNDLETAVT